MKFSQVIGLCLLMLPLYGQTALPPIKLDITLPDPPIFYPVIQALLEVVKATIPIAIGAGLTLLGVWRTNLHQERLQRQAKDEERKFWQVQRNYELKRDALKQCNALLRETEFHFRSWLKYRDQFDFVSSRSPRHEPSEEISQRQLGDAFLSFLNSGTRLAKSIGEAELYVSPEVATAFRLSQIYLDSASGFIAFKKESETLVVAELEKRIQTAVDLSKGELKVA